VLNVGLFLPFGAAAGWRGKWPWRVVLFGALLSTTIELVQTVVPGRDPELRDIVSNTVGTALGVALAYRPRAWLFPNDRRAAWLAGITAVVILAIGVSTAVLLAPVRAQEPMSVSRTENDAVVSYQSHADASGLDQPAYYVRGLFAGETTADPIQVDVSRRWTGWCVRVGGLERCRIGPTLGRGWSVLMYPSVIAHRWADGLLDVVWIAALFFPLGFWTRRRGLALSVSSAIVLLGIAPSLVGLVPTTLSEWIGAAASMLAGFVIAQALRHRYVPQVRNVQG
jgi:VanZ like protein